MLLNSTYGVVALSGWISGWISCSMFFSGRIFSPLIYKGYKSLDSKQKHDWDGRYHSTAHAIVITILSVMALKEFAFQELNVVNWATPLSTLVLNISLGYFIADMLLCIMYPELGGIGIAGHHLVAITCLVAALYLRSCHLFAIYTLISECTTPFVNLRWWLHTMGLKTTKLYLWNGLILTFSWVIVRIFFQSYVFKHIFGNYGVLHTDMPTGIFELILISSLVMIGLNVVWGIKIVKGAIKAMRKAHKD